ncbi:coth protein-domain-containing protein [Helicostylum pulchrum]|nr:coth protein-domain-containing protein [Helicostylum pulchrum]
MLGHTKHSLAFALLGFLVGSARAITYNVIAEPPANMSVAVVVDKVTYPLQATFGILYKGDAPSATTEYHYAFVDNKDVKVSEPFTRPPLKDGLSTTLNEFFNRSISTYEVNTLPQVLEPLSSIHRINSGLHNMNQIPSIHIYGNTSATKYLEDNQSEDYKVKLNVAYIGLDSVQVFENVKISLAGRSSRWIPKLSYGLKFDKKNDTTLFGFKNFKLRALARDSSYLRENLCYSSYRSIGAPASGFSYVRLFIDNKAVGLYGLIETFQNPWAAAEFADGEKGYKAGYLYQGIGFSVTNAGVLKISDLRYEGIDMANYRVGQYKIKAGKHKKRINAYQDLQEFTKFINESSVSTTPESEWEKKLDVDGFLRAMAIENVLGLSDGYMPSANNFYLYRDPNQNNRFTYIAADMDSTIGNGIYLLDLMLSGNYSEHPGFSFRPLTRKIFSYPNYLNKYKEYILKFTQTLVNPSIMFPYIDSVVDMIRPEVEWDQSLPRVGKTVKDPYGSKNTEVLLNLVQSHSPPGLVISFQNRTESFDVAINGPFRDDTRVNLKDFIIEKSSNVLAFYNQPNTYS